MIAKLNYDLLGRLTKEITPDGTLGYEYDPLSNLTTLTLPDGRKVNHLYYGSGHLHQLNLDGQVISDMERDDLHREVYRTQGKLTSCFGYDAMGRKAWQFASTLPGDKLSQVHNTGINTSLLSSTPTTRSTAVTSTTRPVNWCVPSTSCVARSSTSTKPMASCAAAIPAR